MSIPPSENEGIEMRSPRSSVAHSERELELPSTRALVPGTAVQSGQVKVIDWELMQKGIKRMDAVTGRLISDTDVEACPKERDFCDPDSYSAFMSKPCEVPTAMRLVHAHNAPWATSAVDHSDDFDMGDDLFHKFQHWVARDACQRTANLTCFAWNQQGVAYPHLKHEQSLGKFSFDYLTAHGSGLGDQDLCSKGKHSIKLHVPDESSLETDKIYNVCPRRVSVFCRKGRRVEIEGRFSIHSHNPPNLLVVLEDSSHTETMLRFNKSITFGETIDHIGFDETLSCLDELYAFLTDNWSNLLEIAVSHNRNLEDYIYAQPDNDAPARDLWTASKDWLKIERLLHVHTRVAQEVEELINSVLGDRPLRDLHGHRFVSGSSNNSDDSIADREDREDREDKEDSNIGDRRDKDSDRSTIDWPKKFSGQPALKELNRCSILVQDDLIKPTANLLDMMYKSVAIRDTRLSLQLNASLWRLSWITFIFLPLLFLSGFFGMNVDWFSNDPSIKWYFISAAAFFVIFLLVWLIFRLSHRFNLRLRSPSFVV